MTGSFTDEVCKKLDYYVYRLIDPRNGQTFYVGKGKGNRVFQHVKAAENKDALQEIIGQEASRNDEDAFEDTRASLKIETIRAIRSAGLDVLHVIHRHGLSEDEALLVEAALIDAYPGLANAQGGKDSGDYGCRNVEEIKSLYAIKEAEFKDVDRLLLIKITDDSIEIGGSIYEAVRKSWVLAPTRANRADYVLAVKCGIVVGIFLLDEKKWRREGNSNRYYFEGSEVSDGAVASRLLNRRIPDKYRKKGAANPIRYVGL